MNESSIQIPKIEGKIAGIAFDIYTNMLNAAQKQHKEICSLCAKSVGINKDKARTTHFHGSEFGQCFRKTQLDMVSPKEKFDNQKLIQFQDGHLHEESILSLLEHYYNLTHKNEEVIMERIVNLNVDLNFPKNKVNIQKVKIVLHTDAILNLVSSSQRIIIECKAVKDWFWKNKLLKNEIPLSYFGQCQCYLEAHNADYGLFFFKNRHTSEIAYPLIIKRDEVYIKRRLHFLAGILYSNSIFELVPKEYEKKTNDACKFCKHFKLCWLGE